MKNAENSRNSRFLLTKPDRSGRYKGERRITVNKDREDGTDDISLKDLTVFLKDRDISLTRVRLGVTFVTSVLPKSRKSVRRQRKSVRRTRMTRRVAPGIVTTTSPPIPAVIPTDDFAPARNGLKKWANSAVVIFRSILPTNGKVAHNGHGKKELR